MVSRLDRLFILLDTGSSESIRLAAAKQLGEVQRIQPNDLHYLLRRIKEYSKKSVWETRVAAGHATRCVLEQVKTWPPEPQREPNVKQESDNRDYSLSVIIPDHYANSKRILNSFDLQKITSTIPALLSTNSVDDDDLELVSSSSVKKTKGRKSSTFAARKKPSKEQLIRQRQLINKELGISMADSLNLGVKSTDIVSNDDLQPDFSQNDNSSKHVQSSGCQQIDVRQALGDCLSNYERLMDFISESDAINRAKDAQETDDVLSTGIWPLSDISREYANEIFNPSWEVRHGAAIALREIVRLQGHSAGRHKELSKQTNDVLNQIWLIDMALTALCVLCLDCFGDFLFDQVVAPVRENAAQLLGCCVAHLSPENSSLVINILLSMLDNQRWETRHGGILGLKYSLNVLDEETVKHNLTVCFDAIFKCLGDPNDDVSAEAAASLVPVNDLLNKVVPDKTPNLVKFLWDHIVELDELTTSTSSIILLLASLITSGSVKLLPGELLTSIPRLWSLMSHSSTNVRISVLKALLTLIKPQETSCLDWMTEDLLSTALRLVFQRSILESACEVRPLIQDVWLELIRIDRSDKSLAQQERLNLLKSTSQNLNYWLCLTMQPTSLPIDRGNPLWLNIKHDGTKSETKPDGDIYIASGTFNVDTIGQQKAQTTECRLMGTKLLGALYATLVEESKESQHAEETMKYLSDMFAYYLKTKSAHQRMISGWAIESWAIFQNKLPDCDAERSRFTLPADMEQQLKSALQETNVCYDELASNITRLQHEAREFVSSLVASNISTSLPHAVDRRVIYNLNQLQTMCDINIENELTRLRNKRNDKTESIDNHDIKSSEDYSLLSSRQALIIKSYQITKAAQKNYSTATLSSIACALISWESYPLKMKSIADPLLDSIQTEIELTLQSKSVHYLIVLMHFLCDTKDQNNQLIEDIILRLIDHLTCYINDQIEYDGVDATKIIQLDNLQKRAEITGRGTARRQSSINSTTSLKRSHSLTSTSSEVESSGLESDILDADLRHRGVTLALNGLTKHFAADLPEKLPTLWSLLTTDLERIIPRHNTGDASYDTNNSDSMLVKSLALLVTVSEQVDESLHKDLLKLYPGLIKLLSSRNVITRHRCSQCIGLISSLMFEQVEPMIVKQIIPMLEEESDVISRCGSIEAIALIIDSLQLDLIPRINMFIVPVLRRMSDQNDQVRLMATHCFGKLLSLMPLNMEKKEEIKTDEGQDLCRVSQDEFEFIEQLLNPRRLTNYEIPFETKAQLRSYQQEGLNWLAFLNKFNLHGILCDEMGLGKTFMTICMVASDHFKKQTNESKSRLPSLIVCPSTLIEHWLYEIEKFVSSEARSILNPVAYSGPMGDRMSLRNQISNMLDVQTNAPRKAQATNIIVTSYDVLRNDIDFFRSIKWNYCVLDEGHIMKNGKTKLSKAIRLLTASHRLILSGTPIQNNVTELWSLFDFLMPGFLGSERQFNSRFTKPILQSREPKCSSRELEAGALAMESLHRQVLPFILRRLKEDVLDDLPPKIIQDYYCELSPLQSKLYEDFTRSKLCNDVTKKSLDLLSNDNIEADKSNSKSHVFQALQYLKNVCNHPKLVLSPKHPHFNEIKKALDLDVSNLNDINHSSKLKALKQLLIDCGIGVANLNSDDGSAHPITAPAELESVVNQHRALIFCQLRSMVDIIENDLLKNHLSNITYLRLDGSIPTNQRQSIVTRFNSDPSIDILLLTTQIGGLGLNLTGADTVIFVEHDWNPTKDLQAMDRAHRIGQKKVVNVYRLITKSTLEEKIMGLQKFKTIVSSTVINQDNTGLSSMNVDQLLDLFDDSTKRDKPSKLRSSKGTSNLSDLLPELWDQQQYETEYDLSTFVSSMKS